MIKNNDKNALKYFSMEEAYGVIHFATYKEVIVKLNDARQDDMCSYVLTENTMSYKSIANLCSMPVNFLFNLLRETDNPEWTMAVIDLLLEEQNTDLVLMIQDQINKDVNTQIQTFRFVHKTKVEKWTGNGYDDRGIPKSPSYNGSVVTEWEWPAGGEEIDTWVRTTYTNTTTVFVKKAYTWCLDFEQEAVPNNTEEFRRTCNDRADLFKFGLCKFKLS